MVTFTQEHMGKLSCLEAPMFTNAGWQLTLSTSVGATMHFGAPFGFIASQRQTKRISFLNNGELRFHGDFSLDYRTLGVVSYVADALWNITRKQDEYWKPQASCEDCRILHIDKFCPVKNDYVRDLRSSCDRFESIKKGGQGE